MQRTRRGRASVGGSGRGRETDGCRTSSSDVSGRSRRLLSGYRRIWVTRGSMTARRSRPRLLRSHRPRCAFHKRPINKETRRLVGDLSDISIWPARSTNGAYDSSAILAPAAVCASACARARLRAASRARGPIERSLGRAAIATLARPETAVSSSYFYRRWWRLRAERGSPRAAGRAPLTRRAVSNGT